MKIDYATFKEYVKGQKVTGIKECEDDVWIMLEEDVIIFKLPQIEFRCLNCVEKEREGNGSKSETD